MEGAKEVTGNRSNRSNRSEKSMTRQRSLGSEVNSSQQCGVPGAEAMDGNGDNATV
jgi:hypothetical protein